MVDGSEFATANSNLGKLVRAMEYLLAHNGPILTANYLLRPHEV